jgi:hypothetical protein
LTDTELDGSKLDGSNLTDTEFDRPNLKDKLKDTEIAGVDLFSLPFSPQGVPGGVGGHPEQGGSEGTGGICSETEKVRKHIGMETNRLEYR